jgi:phage shock protein PspC (stress-responsive transcriptional regulator)
MLSGMQMPRSIERSREDRVVAGVCGGIARAADLDPTTVRVIAVVLMAFGGVGLIAYVAAALLLPEEGGGEPLIRLAGSARDRGAAIAGAGLLLLLAVVVVAGDPWPWDRGWFVVAALVLGGLAWMALRERDGASATLPAAPAEPPATGATRVRPTWEAEPPAPPPPPSPGDRTRRRVATAVAAGVLAILLGAAALTFVAVFDDPPWDVYAAGAVMAAGVVLVLSAPFGGSPALVVPAFLVAAVVGVFALGPVPLRGGVGERDHRPATLESLRDEYRLAAGDLRLDLTEVPFPVGTTRTRVELGMGEAVVTVPADVDVRVDGSAVAGEVVTFGRATSGVDVDTVEDGAGSAAAAGRRLALDVHVGFGQIRVERDEPPRG